MICTFIEKTLILLTISSVGTLLLINTLNTKAKQKENKTQDN